VDLSAILKDLGNILSKFVEFWGLIGQLGKDIGLFSADGLNIILTTLGIAKLTSPLSGSIGAVVVLVIALEIVRRGGDTVLGMAKATWNSLLMALMAIIILTAIPNLL
jgi:hypothetical protein